MFGSVLDAYRFNCQATLGAVLTPSQGSIIALPKTMVTRPVMRDTQGHGIESSQALHAIRRMLGSMMPPPHVSNAEVDSEVACSRDHIASKAFKAALKARTYRTARADYDTSHHDAGTFDALDVRVQRVGAPV